MATQKTKTDLENEVKEKDKELEKIKSQNETFEAKLAKMEKMIESMSNGGNVAVKQDDEKISLDEDIPVVNLTNGQVNISTEGYGQGDITTFDKHGEIIDIPYSDLKLYVRKNKRFFQEGILYILDDRAVKQERLSSAYKKLLSEDMIDNLLNNVSDKVIEIYKTATKGQKEIIIDKIVNKKLNHESVDANILLELGKLSGKNLIDVENPDDIPLDK